MEGLIGGGSGFETVEWRGKGYIYLGEAPRRVCSYINAVQPRRKRSPGNSRLAGRLAEYGLGGVKIGGGRT